MIDEFLDRILKRLADSLSFYIKEQLRDEVRQEMFEKSLELPNEVYQIEPLEHSINNFDVIDTFVRFEKGSFYKFELLVRNTDGENVLFPERCSNTNRNIVIKSWYVDTQKYYESIKHEMVTLCNLTGARLYVTLDRKDNVKLVNSLLHSLSDTLTAIVIGQEPSIKKISKVIASETSKEENSSPKFRTIMFDVDTQDEIIKDAVIDYIEMEHVNPKGEVCPKVKAHVLKTKKGYHIFCYRKFNYVDWEDKCLEFISNDWNIRDSRDQIISYHEKFTETVSVKANELGLVYHPMKTNHG